MIDWIIKGMKNKVTIILVILKGKGKTQMCRKIDKKIDKIGKLIKETETIWRKNMVKVISGKIKQHKAEDYENIKRRGHPFFTHPCN